MFIKHAQINDINNDKFHLLYISFLMHMIFFLVSSYLLYHVFPMVGASERSSIWFSQVISNTLWSLVTSHDVFHSLEFSTHTYLKLLFSISSWTPAASFTDPQAVSVFHTAQGWSWPVARHLSGVMPLSIHWVVWLPRPVVLPFSNPHASVGVVSSATVVSRKLLQYLSHFWTAECSWSECRLS